MVIEIFEPTVQFLMLVWLTAFAGIGLYYTTWEPKSRKESVRVMFAFFILSGLTGGFVHTTMQISVVGTFFFIPIVHIPALLVVFLTNLRNPL